LPTDKPNPIKEGAPEPLTENDIEIGDVTEIAERRFPNVVIPNTDTGADMFEEILLRAFPHLHRILVEEYELDDNDEPKIDLAAVEGAVRAEAQVAVRASWRWANVVRSEDKDALIAAAMGTSVENVRQHRKRMEERTEGEED